MIPVRRSIIDTYDVTVWAEITVTPVVPFKALTVLLSTIGVAVTLLRIGEAVTLWMTGVAVMSS